MEEKDVSKYEDKRRCSSYTEALGHTDIRAKWLTREHEINMTLVIAFLDWVLQLWAKGDKSGQGGCTQRESKKTAVRSSCQED